MRMHRMILVFLLCGCAGLPFEPVPLVPVQDWNPVQVRSEFEQKLAGDFKTSEAGIFKYKGREFSVLSYTRVSSRDKTVSAAGLTPLGVKLFEITAGTDGVKDYSFSIPQIKNKIDPARMASAMAEDVWRIYMARIPASGSEIQIEKDRILFRSKRTDGALEYVFGGENGVLLEKSFKKGRRKIWSVRYFEYRAQGGKIYASKIIYENLQRHYTLILNLKEIFA